MITQNPIVEAFHYLNDNKLLIYVDNTQQGLFDYYQILGGEPDIKIALKKRYNSEKVIVNLISNQE
ncbi:MAG: hypothetical protein QXV17_14265 [Candidatus Micrarchaeaceae archaeon]